MFTCILYVDFLNSAFNFLKLCQKRCKTGFSLVGCEDMASYTFRAVHKRQLNYFEYSAVQAFIGYLSLPVRLILNELCQCQQPQNFDVGIWSL